MFPTTRCTDTLPIPHCQNLCTENIVMPYADHEGPINYQYAFGRLGILLDYTLPRLDSTILLPEQQRAFSKLEMNKDEREIYKKIVAGLLNFFVEEGKKYVPSETGAQCALVFRKSRSWKEVEDMLLKAKHFPKRHPSDTAVQWANQWLARIDFFRRCEQKYRTILQKCPSEQEAYSSLKAFKKNQQPLHGEIVMRYILCNQALKRIRPKLAEKLREARLACKPENVPTRVEAFPDMKRIVELLRRDWDRLTLFYWVSDVGVDEEKVDVKIINLHDEVKLMKSFIKYLQHKEKQGGEPTGEREIRVKNLIKYIEKDDAEMVEKGLKPKNMLQHLQECLGGWVKCDQSTRAIFTIAPEGIIHDDDSITFTKNFEIRSPHLASLSPHPITGQARRTYLEEFQPGGTCASDTALRLYDITKVAVMELNETLAWYTSVREKQKKLNNVA